MWDIRSLRATQDEKRKPVMMPSLTISQCEFNECKRPHGTTSLSLSSTGTKLIANSTDNSIYLYDLANQDVCHGQRFTGHTTGSFYGMC